MFFTHFSYQAHEQYVNACCLDDSFCLGVFLFWVKRMHAGYLEVSLRSNCWSRHISCRLIMCRLFHLDSYLPPITHQAVDVEFLFSICSNKRHTIGTVPHRTQGIPNLGFLPAAEQPVARGGVLIGQKDRSNLAFRPTPWHLPYSPLLDGFLL